VATKEVEAGATIGKQLKKTEEDNDDDVPVEVVDFDAVVEGQWGDL
jgi:hypothetical protein